MKCKEEILRFILDSSNAENESLAVFVAGIQAQKTVFKQEKEKKISKTEPASTRKGKDEKGFCTN